MRKLKVFEVVNSKNRITSVDIFRGIAIIAVVLYHYNYRLPYGYLGVDLFFVISGLLVGGLLTKEFKNGKKINFWKFFLQRGFKIWPSYYVFLLIGSGIAFLFYHETNPAEIIPLWNIKKYLFFYQNYAGLPFQWSFGHVWSLCVEEHFYILLPLMFLFIQHFVPAKNKLTTLFVFVCLTIIAGVVFKNLSFFYTRSKDTSSGTLNKIDALAWGVLLNLVITYCGEKIRSMKFVIITFVSGLLVFIAALYYSIRYDNTIYEQIYFTSITPFAFFLMLLGLYYLDFSKLKPLRIIAYYSYNWYLWHPIFCIYITRTIGNNIMGLLVYMAGTFLIGVLATIFIEEKILDKRKAILDKTFKTKASG